MNVFYTNSDPIIAASEHCLIHQRKMIIEYAQLLSSAHHVLDGDNCIDGIYKLTHKNHPSAIWCRSSDSAYNWILNCALELCRLYTASTGKVHATESKLFRLSKLPINIIINDFSPPPIAAPDKYKALAVFNGVAVAYQSYLCDKFKEWQSREKPLKVEFVSKPYWM